MNKKAFTLIEIIVALTIFSIFMVSMIMIYASSANLWYKVDLNRAMQENTKNIVETIAEDVRKNWIDWVSKTIVWDSCSFSSTSLYKVWDKLCTKTNKYYLAIYDGTNYNRVEYNDIKNKCLNNLKNKCVLVKSDWVNITPLSNSLVRFTDLKFYVSNTYIPKVTIIFELRPSIKKWVKINSIKNSVFKFETTISSRLIKTK